MCTSHQEITNSTSSTYVNSLHLMEKHELHLHRYNHSPKQPQETLDFFKKTYGFVYFKHISSYIKETDLVI